MCSSDLNLTTLYNGNVIITGSSGDFGKSGYSGISGYSGASGESGFSGVSGFSGLPGEFAASGYSGYSGYSGVSTTPGGNNTDVQFNDSGIFGGSDAFTFNKTSNTVTTTNLVSSNAYIRSTVSATRATININPDMANIGGLANANFNFADVTTFTPVSRGQAFISVGGNVSGYSGVSIATPYTPYTINTMLRNANGAYPYIGGITISGSINGANQSLANATVGTGTLVLFTGTSDPDTKFTAKIGRAHV